MSLRPHRSRSTHALLASVLALVVGVALGACGGDDGTTTVEPSTTEPVASSSTTLLSNPEAIDAMIETWTQMGFTEEQATCLVEEMNELSSTIGDASDLRAGDVNRIEQMMDRCKIDETDMSRLAG
ncbi:MAG: hypothetical protein ACYC2O_11595 [Microthrixaceae bacterium]